MLRRNKDISISVSPSANDGDSFKVQDDQKGQLADDASNEVPMEGTDAVKSPSNHSNERTIPQRCQQIASKVALKSIGKIAQLELKNNKNSSSNNVKDESSTF